LEAHRDPGRYQFLEEQVALIGRRLRESEEELQTLKQSRRITEFDEERGHLLTHVRQLEAELDALDLTVAELEAEVTAFRSLLDKQDRYVEMTVDTERNPRNDTLRSELLATELEHLEAKQRYQPGSRPLRELEMRLDRLSKKLASEETDLVSRRTSALNEVYLEAQKALLIQEARLSALRGKRALQQATLDKRWAEIRDLDSNWMQLQRLERQIQLDDDSYHLYSKKLEEARIADVLDSEHVVSVKVIQPPVASLAPVRPRKMWIAGLGLLLAVLLPLGIVLLLDYLDDSMLKPEDVEDRLGLSVLASVRQL
jgi:tyrosine-protein kinase Etk/Wzc